jgi:Cu+-exporting ATPase
MEKRLSVQGMTCQHCVRRVAQIIEKARGVLSVQVSLENKEAVIRCDPSLTDMPGVVKELHDFGFNAEEKS